jgi:hypothetical protein
VHGRGRGHAHVKGRHTRQGHARMGMGARMGGEGGMHGFGRGGT